jgi:acetyl esterase/lipase
MTLIDKLLENNKYNKIILVLIALFIIISVVYTSIYFKKLENEGNYTLYNDIPYAKYKNYDIESTSLDIYTPNNEIDANYPVIIFIHGGAWTKFLGSKNDWHRFLQKGIFFTDHNFILVNINYRLAPNVKFPQPEKDVVDAIRWVYDNIYKYGGDKNNIYIKGHSAGAQIASLIATDSRYLNEENLDLNVIKGVILLEGVGYDLTLAEKEGLENKIIDFYYTLPFGDENSLKDASSINYITPKKNIPPFIIFASENSVFRIGKKEAELFHKKLKENGYYSELYIISGEGHSSLNRNFGEDNHLPTKYTMDFLNKINS